jgi:thiol-disulfide isomerase/thioredoxin
MRLFNSLVILCGLLSIDVQADKVRFTGKWDDGPQVVQMTYIEDVVTRNEKTLTTAIDPASRQFQFAIDLSRPTVILFQNQSIIVFPGDTVNVQITGKEPDVEMRFTGRYGDQHSFLIRLNKVMGEFIPSKFRIDEPSLEKYKVSATHHYDSSLLFLMSDASEQKISKEFRKAAQGYLTALYYSNLLYPVSSGLISIDKLPKYYFELVNFSFFKSTEFLGFPEFMAMLSQYNDFYYSRISTETSYDSASVARRIRSANHNFFGEVKDNLLLFIFAELARHGTDVNDAQIQTLYEYLTGVFGDQTQRVAEMQALKYSYDIVDEPLPLRVLEQELKTPKGKTITLAQVLAVSDVVYLDFWTTSCAKCLSEIPAQQQLMAELEGAQIKFVRISFDQDEKAWAKAISKMKIEGDHYLIPEGFSSAIAQYLSFNEIPRYIILDKEGRLVTRRASQPSLLLQNKSELLSLME